MPIWAPRFSLYAAELPRLAAIVETGDEEHQRDHESELGVRTCVQANLHDAIHDPCGTSDKPDPG